jgi:hypothetical protein
LGIAMGRVRHQKPLKRVASMKGDVGRRDNAMNGDFKPTAIALMKGGAVGRRDPPVVQVVSQ